MSNLDIDMMDKLEIAYEKAKLRRDLQSFLSLSQIADRMRKVADKSYKKGRITKEEFNIYTTKACLMALETTAYYIKATVCQRYLFL